MATWGHSPKFLEEIRLLSCEFYRLVKFDLNSLVNLSCLTVTKLYLGLRFRPFDLCILHGGNRFHQIKRTFLRISLWLVLFSKIVSKLLDFTPMGSISLFLQFLLFLFDNLSLREKFLQFLFH